MDDGVDLDAIIREFILFGTRNLGEATVEELEEAEWDFEVTDSK